METQVKTEEPLVLTPPIFNFQADEAAVKNALSLTKQAEPKALTEAEQRAKQFIDNLFVVKGNQNYTQTLEAANNTISQLGREAAKNTLQSSNAMLQMSTKHLNKTNDGATIANKITELREITNKLSPSQNNLLNGKLFGFIPIPKNLTRYFHQYESSQKQIKEILTGLENGKRLLERDNQVLQQERQRLYHAMQILSKDMEFVKQCDIYLQNKIDSAKMQGELQPELEELIIKEVKFPLTQKLGDLQTELAVSVNAQLANDVIIQSNKELMRGVERCQTTTVSALQTAITTAIALNNQKLVIDTISGVNKTTNDLVVATSEMLKNNAAAIYQQSTKQAITMETLEQVFNNVTDTLDAIDSYKIQALESMTENNKRLEALNQRALARTEAEQNKKITQFLN